ncbi:hypothetical protein SBA7_1050006 [Candidatus Sulfotelmatobacter sp. SbA7]|nr:hypothetical protein SBA7_1050006 [Candidatus Sulfotelmatobacter sp. SbA7]
MTSPAAPTLRKKREGWGTRLALRHTIYLFSNGSGKGHAPSDMLGCGHGIIIHQFGA